MDVTSTLNFDTSPSHDRYDAVVVGSGPNGLAAAITIAREGRSVLVIESAHSIGGGMRSAKLTLPGFIHDVCSSIHALAVVSPFFLQCSLAEEGLCWDYPEAPVAHPLGGNVAAIGERSLDKAVSRLGVDGQPYRKLFAPLVAHADQLFAQLLSPLGLPRHPLLMARFGLPAVRSAHGLAKSCFTTDLAQGLFAGHAAHSVMPLENRLTAAVGMMLAITAHAGGWPVARGGSQSIADAMARHLIKLGGEIIVGNTVSKLTDIPQAKAVVFDTAPQAVSRIAGDALPSGYRSTLERYRFGPGAFKIDWALAAPIPWEAPECARASTVHVGGTLDEIAASERAPWQNVHAEKPFVLVAQPSLFDATRAPPEKHTAWGYCHVPHGSTVDMTDRIEAQVERFAPGFRERILQRYTIAPKDFENYNANYIGGDITGGVLDFRQLFTRPAVRLVPYSTPAKNIFICSASTPPGGGVHGMCGYHAARAVLRTALRD